MNINPTLKAGQELRSTNRPIYGASTVTHNNTIYIYGGFYNVAPWNKEALWELSNSIDQLIQIDTNPSASPAVIYHSLQSINNKIYSFGGHLSADDILSPPLANTTELLRYYKFDIHLLKWAPLQKKNITASPLERFWHTTVQFDNTVYLYGGMNITGGGFNDFWKYNANLDVWSEINQHQQHRCGHTSTITDDGRMIVLGGFNCANTTFLSSIDKSVYSLSNAVIFNTLTTEWYSQTLGGIIPSARIFHTAVKIHDNIIICGGQDGRAAPFQTYLSNADMTAILDLETWKWNPVPESPYQPSSSSFSIANVVNETSMVYGLGLNSHIIKDGFYVFDSETNSWISPLIQDKVIKSNIVPTSAIILFTIIGAILCFFLIGFWVLRKYKARVFSSVKKGVWNPRAGEPLWAEISRLLFRFSFLGIFIIMSAVLALQVQHSPIIDQIYRDENKEMMAPDIRFCFDGWINQPVLHCTTNFGESCSHLVQDITQKVTGNLNYHGLELACYLFSGHQEFKLGTNRLENNGSFIQFYYYGNTTNNSIIHVELYNPFHNPNIPVYNLTGTFDQWYNKDEIAKFQSDEQLNLKTRNVFNIDPLNSSQIGYQFKRREKIDHTLWNYLGFGTKREILHQIETTKYQTNTIDDTTENEYLGSLHVFPTSYNITVMREQRAFTVIHAMGIIGGIFGLIISFQASVFGYRPRSPWGIVHRWSVELVRKSLLNGLRTRFSNDFHVPIVQPVHQNIQESNRMIKLEERLHVFEFLFQAYYIDDEVFRSLGGATTEEEGV